ncbi:MAG TPA: molecular chaperone DnaJ [Polyangiaceae bacterium]|jgi:molecular chaperone DnaJ|nr:molecular chaperone DnaJ [Polyangiaceae bacterium]
MSAKRCYYEVLGVAREASCGDIRKAYKRLALELHPDRNKSPDATERFKEATEAFSILSDDDKRQRYDRFGHAGVEGAIDFGGADIFSHFQDIFSDVFGSDFFGGFGFSGRQRRGPARGRDLRVEQRLTLEEAVIGCKKEISLTTPVHCGECKGSGARPGTSPTTCATCGGRGQVSSGRGFIMFTQACPSCRGEGATISDPCKRCRGSGYEEKQRTVTVTFPAGIDTGHRLRVSGQGMPGPSGGPSGNLYVDVGIEPHERFEREGIDLLMRQSITFIQAALGTKVDVTLIDGSVERLSIDAGTQPGTVLTLPGKGVPSVNARGRGALHVVVHVDVPRRLSRRAKKLLRELEEELSPEDEALRTG